jgi:nitrogen regulatory protein PII
MKKIEALFLEEKMGEVRDAIFKQGVHRFVVSQTIVHEFGRPRPSRWRSSSEATDDESATVKLEVVVPDEISHAVAKAILDVAHTRHPKVSLTITPVDEFLEVTLSHEQPRPNARRRGTSSTPDTSGTSGTSGT